MPDTSTTLAALVAAQSTRANAQIANLDTPTPATLATVRASLVGEALAADAYLATYGAPAVPVDTQPTPAP